MGMGITSRLASFVVNTSFSDIPGSVTEKSKDMMLNAAAVGLAGSREKEGKIIVEYVQQSGGAPVCTVMGAGFRSSAANTALAHGVMVHVLDYDEAIMRRGNHPSNAIFPVVMPLGEQLGLPGREVLAAFTIGCEVSTKIGAAGDLEAMHPTMSQFGWHLEGVPGTIGAAAAAGKLLGLNQEHMENALGIAVSQASGLKVNFGTSTKSFHCGHAAMSGIMAAVLAQKGFTGARNAIEAANGFLECYRRDSNVDEERFIQHLGNPYDVIDPGVAIKLYPCGSATHSSIDAILHLIREHRITPQQVQSVHVATTPESAGMLLPPETGLQGKFNMGYCMAVALVHGQPQIHHFTDAAVKDPRVRALLHKVTQAATERPTREVSRPSSVTVTLIDGRTFSHRVEHARGHSANPLTQQELGAKFAYCSREVLPPKRIEAAIDQFRRLETLPKVASLAGILGGYPQ